MGKLDDAEIVHPVDRAAWRAWLAANHESSTGVWLASYNKSSGKDRVPYEELVEELLCFGWVDSTARKLDGERGALYVAPRKKGSTWASTNKERVARLIADGAMTEAGLEVIDRAKEDGSWTILDPVEALEVPDDLAQAFRTHPDVEAGYQSLGPGGKKQVLWHVISAKRPETRKGRIAGIVERGLAGGSLVP